MYKYDQYDQAMVDARVEEFRDQTRRRIEGTTLLARALQHEMDHLDGKLYVDRLRGLNRTVILSRIRKLEKDGKW